ncbi:MAG TPA: hypothetical protein VLJ60_08350, partial [bacterium]|nr:hypothetical protein [bacterium]
EGKLPTSSSAFDITKKIAYMQADANTFADSLTMNIEKPIDVPREIVELIYNGFLIGGAEMSSLTQKNLTSSVNPNLINDFKKYFAQKSFDNFVDFCGYAGIMSNVVEKYKLLNFFFRIGKKSGAAPQGDTAKTPLFPLMPISTVVDKDGAQERPIKDAQLVFVKMGDISLEIHGANAFESSFEEALKSAIGAVGGIASVEIMDSLGHKQIINGVTAKNVFLSSSDQNQEMNKLARTDIKIGGKDKSFFVSLKKGEDFSYWGGLSGERREQKISRTDLSDLANKRSIESDAASFKKSAATALAMTIPSLVETIQKKYPLIKTEIGLPSQASAREFLMGLKGYFVMKKLKKEAVSPDILEIVQAMSQNLYGLDEEMKLNTKNISLKDVKSRTDTKFLGFWSMMYQYETIIRQMLFGERSEMRKSFPDAESASHIIVGMPTISEDKTSKKVFVVPSDASVIIANKEFLLHDPVGNKSQETGLSLNKDFFAGSLPVFVATEKNKETTAGIERLYSRAVPLNFIVKKSERATVYNNIISTLRKSTAFEFKGQLKSISDFLAVQSKTPGYFRLEKDTIDDDIREFLRVFNKGTTIELDFVYDLFIVLREQS